MYFIKLLKNVLFIKSALKTIVNSTRYFSQNVLYKWWNMRFCSRRTVHNCKKYTFYYSMCTL